MVSFLSLSAWLLGWFRSRPDWLEPLTLVVSGADAILKDALNVAMVSCFEFSVESSFVLSIYLFLPYYISLIFPEKKDAPDPDCRLFSRTHRIRIVQSAVAGCLIDA